MFNPIHPKRPPSTLPRSARRAPRLLARSPRSQALALTGLLALLLPLPGCQSITGSPSLAQVRVIDASTYTAGLDIYQGSAILAYNLGLGTITSYVPVSPGNYGIIANTAGSKAQVVAASGTFSANGQYTALITDNASTVQEQILKDQSTPAPSGQVALRFLNQAQAAGGVDVYLIPTGATIATVVPVLTNLVYGKNSGYLNVPNGTYTMAVVATGTVPTVAGTTLYTGAAITYASGAARTFVYTSTQSATITTVQVISADDYDLPSATS